MALIPARMRIDCHKHGALASSLMGAHTPTLSNKYQEDVTRHNNKAPLLSGTTSDKVMAIPKLRHYTRTLKQRNSRVDVNARLLGMLH